MNYPSLALAALGATVVYFILGGLVFGLSPLRHEFAKFPAVYRTQADMKGVWPLGIAGMLLAMFAVTALYALTYREGPWMMDGTRFGMLVGAYAVGSFVLHNHVNLNIGLRLTVGQAVAYFAQWTLVGMVIASIYHPALR